MKNLCAILITHLHHSSYVVSSVWYIIYISGRNLVKFFKGKKKIKLIIGKG